MSITITDIQQFQVAIAVEDRRGNPASVIAPPTWAASNPSALTVTPAADGLSATVAAAGPVGTFQVTVNGDGGPNVGDDPFTGALDVIVTSSAATQVVFSTGTVTNQP